ncbi:MAG: hypothetical protein JXR56_00905 [Candidatus Cloacimonetes bacterium]|nr:hypothetical protein [Candidatus Cloacimonadota bacterium]
MRRFRPFYYLFLGLLILTGCSKSGASLKVHNNTSNRLWVTMDGETTLLEGNDTVSHKYKTPSYTIFSGQKTKEVTVGITGETFRIYDYFADRFVEESKVILNVDETEHIYCNSNLACLKVVNNADIQVNTVKYTKRHSSGVNTSTTIPQEPPLGYGDEWFSPVDGFYATPFYYYIEAFLSNGNVVAVGDSATTSLHVGDVFTFVITEDIIDGE